VLKRTVQIGVAACVVALMAGGLSVAQQGGAGGGPGMFDPNQIRQMMAGGMFDPTRIRQMMMERTRERLGVKEDAEWKVIEPRLRKLMDLNQQTLMGRAQGMLGMLGAFGMFGGGRGGPGGGNDGGQTPPLRGSGPNGEMTASDKAMAQLRTTLANQSAAPEEIKRALTAVREAGAKLQQDRAVAQADLKKILTLRQEGVLVEMGQMD
jgi:hypothetical protein